MFLMRSLELFSSSHQTINTHPLNMFVLGLLVLASVVSLGQSCYNDQQCYADKVCVRHDCQCPFGTLFDSRKMECVKIMCDFDQECARYFANTQCQFDSYGIGSCFCSPSYYFSNSSQTCLPIECHRDRDCNDKNKVCASGRCECKLGYILNSYGDCIRYKCSLDIQCKTLFGGGTYCNRTDSTCFCPKDLLIGANSCPIDKNEAQMIMAAFVVGLVVMLSLVLVILCICCCFRCICCCCCKRKTRDVERQPLINDSSNYYH